MRGLWTRSLDKLSSVFLGSVRSRILAALFAAVVAMLIGHLWYRAHRVERIALPMGVGQSQRAVHRLQLPAASPEILLLNSYHTGYTWSDNELAGILATLSNTTPEPIVSVEHLDCKHHPRMEHFDQVRDLLQRKYRERPPPVIVVAVDNPALVFAKKYRPGLFPSAAIVFCGVNGYSPSLLEGERNITGVAERFDVRRTLEVALRLHPSLRSVYVVHDYTLTGLSSRQETEEQLRAFEGRLRIHYLEDLSVDQLAARARALPSDSIALALSYSVDRDGTLVNHEAAAHLLSTSSPVPVYGLHEERLGFGIIGGSLLGGRTQGTNAARIVARILAGESADSIPIDTHGDGRLMFDWKQLERFRISPHALPPDAVVVNRPLSFLEIYRGIALTTMAIIGVLIAGIAVLGLSMFRREQAERAMAESERNFKALFETAADAIFIEDAGGAVLDANAEALRLTGRSKAELRSVSLRDLIGENRRDALTTRARELAETGRSLLECDIVSSSGGSVPVEMSGRAIEFFGKPAVLTIARDLSERKKSEQEREKLFAQLLQAQKMESIGRLAGGVAHDFNNILTAIFGYCHILMARLAPDDPNRTSVQVIRESGERAAALTRQLLAFSRKQVLETRPLDLNTILDGLQKMLVRVIGDDVHLVFVPGDVERILADPTQVEQVVMNLVVNARDAMPDGGKLVIETSQVELDPGSVAPHGVEPGTYAMLAVSDTGKGMTPEVREHVFEPFFTTKEVGKGTGLGLATVYGIVKQHNGLINVYSEPGLGTTIRVYFPSTALPAAEGRASSDLIRTGTETVLVVDDDALIVDIVTRTLEPLGYRVLQTTLPREALELARSSKERIDLLLTDVIMRDMNGRELAKAVLEQAPSTRVLFMSGYTDNLLTLEGMLSQGARLLQKPFAPRALASMVREVLDAAKE